MVAGMDVAKLEKKIQLIEKKRDFFWREINIIVLKE